MTNNATPKSTRPGRPARGPKYPASIAVMLTTEQRAQVDAVAKAGGLTLGETVRRLLEVGLALDAAYLADPPLEADVAKLAVEAGVETSEALGTMLRFAVRESERRTARNGKISLRVWRTASPPPGSRSTGSRSATSRSTPINGASATGRSSRSSPSHRGS